MLGQGTILGNRYRIVNHIGNGGSGNVYLAMDIHIGKNWAIKQIKLQNGKEKILAANEVKMMKQLDYKMFPRIIDAWQEDEDYFIVSDYIEGVSMDWLAVICCVFLYVQLFIYKGSKGSCIIADKCC